MIRCVLTRDVPAFRLAAGTPAHIVKTTRDGRAMLRVGGRLGWFLADEFTATTKGRTGMASNAKDCCTKTNDRAKEREQVLIE